MTQRKSKMSALASGISDKVITTVAVGAVLSVAALGANFVTEGGLIQLLGGVAVSDLKDPDDPNSVLPTGAEIARLEGEIAALSAKVSELEDGMAGPKLHDSVAAFLASQPQLDEQVAAARLALAKEVVSVRNDVEHLGNTIVGGPQFYKDELFVKFCTGQGGADCKADGSEVAVRDTYNGTAVEGAWVIAAMPYSIESSFRESGEDRLEIDYTSEPGRLRMEYSAPENNPVGHEKFRIVYIYAIEGSGIN